MQKAEIFRKFPFGHGNATATLTAFERPPPLPHTPSNAETNGATTPKSKQDGLKIKPSKVLFHCLTVFHLAASFVKRRVAGVEILAVQMLLCDAEGVG